MAEACGLGTASASSTSAAGASSSAGAAPAGGNLSGCASAGGGTVLGAPAEGGRKGGAAALRSDPPPLGRRPNGDDAYAMRMSLVAAVPPPQGWSDAPLLLRLMTAARPHGEPDAEKAAAATNEEDEEQPPAPPPGTLAGVARARRSLSKRPTPPAAVSPCAWRRYEMRTHSVGQAFSTETPLFKGNVLVRADKTMFRGTAQEFMVTVQGQFKELIRFDELVSGYLFSDTLHNMNPKWLVEMGVNFARRFYYPVLEGSLLDAQPFLVMPLVLAPDSLHVALPGDEPALDSLPQESTKLLGGRFKDGKGDKKRRRTLLNNQVGLRSYHYQPEYVYTFYFTGAAFLPRTFELKLPGIGRWDLLKHFGCQPVMGLAWHRRTSVPVVAGELWHLRSVESLGLDLPNPASHPVEDETLSAAPPAAEGEAEAPQEPPERPRGGAEARAAAEDDAREEAATMSPPAPAPRSLESSSLYTLIAAWRALTESWWVVPVSKPVGAIAYALHWFVVGEREVNLTRGWPRP